MFKGHFEISHSDYKDYKVCPYRFLLKYKLKQQGIYPRSPNSRKFLDGWCVHKCLELWNKLGRWESGWLQEAVVIPKDDRVGFRLSHRDVSQCNLIDQVIDKYLEKNIVIWSSNFDRSQAVENIRQGLHLLDYWVPVLELNRTAIESEHFFKISSRKLNVIVKGYVDLVDRENLAIYDMKFSKSGYTDWEQLFWYGLLISLETGKKIQKVATFNPLNDYPIEEKLCDVDTFKSAANQIVEFVGDIRSGKLDPCPGDGCFNCAVGKECEYNTYKRIA
jgi:hypothetical protein